MPRNTEATSSGASASIASMRTRIAVKSAASDEHAPALAAQHLEVQELLKPGAGGVRVGRHSAAMRARALAAAGNSAR